MRCGNRGIFPGQREPAFSGDAVERVRPRPDGVEAVFPVSFMEGPVPPGPRDAVGRIPPCPPGASEVAKRMEGAGLPALSDSDTPPGDLPPHRYVPGPCYARPYGWLTR